MAYSQPKQQGVIPILQRPATLILKYLREELMEAERGELDIWLANPANRQFFEQLTNNTVLQEKFATFNEFDRDQAWNKFQADTFINIRTAHRIHFLKTTWFRYAAAVILLLGIGGYLLWSDRGEIPAKGRNDKGSFVRTQPVNNNKAILTLASGKKIELDNNKTPLLVKEGAVFDPREAGQKPGVASYNTITTSKGGQYQIMLPDGTKVWLNAASSIKFPTAFTGKTRTVQVTGEIYFEVAVNKMAPFFVSTKGMDVQVLGTSFNMNTYEDEEAIRTTLVEGSVKVKSNNNEVLLKPGEQASLNHRKTPASESIRVQTTNIDEAIAWKNGIFNFNNKPFSEIMRQIARWYDIEIIYENVIPDISFEGEMGRDVNLSTILIFLEKAGVHFRKEGKKLIVSK